MTPSAGRVEGHLADIPLFLASRKKGIVGAAQVTVGSIRLRQWQVHRIQPMPADFSGHSGYLVKVNYEFDFEPGAPAPTWAEVGFEFAAREAMVSDALPRSVSRYEDNRSYDLTAHLAFALAEGRSTGRRWDAAAAGLIALPAVSPRIDCFGIGSSDIRWRHSMTLTQPVPLGSHVGWLVLLVADGRQHVQVVAYGGYDLGHHTPAGLAPLARSDAFVVDLPAGAAEPMPAAVSDARAGRSPRVFVSYAHDTAEHKKAVAELCALLNELGVDVRVDQESVQRRDWNKWTNIQILRADFVIAVASPGYRAADEGVLPPDYHQGVQSELARLADLLHEDRTRWTSKILPVVLPGRSVAEIPLTFLPHIADHYVVDSFTPHGAASLLAVLGLDGRQP